MPLEELLPNIEGARRGLGRKAGDVFAFLCPSALAAASIAQVHRATLKDGAEVLVKVQHVGVRDALRADVAILPSAGPGGKRAVAAAPRRRRRGVLRGHDYLST